MDTTPTIAGTDPGDEAGSSVASSEPTLAPRLTGLLAAVGLDVAYHRAAGDTLYFRDDAGRDVPVLDMVGGFGSLILGHHHPQLVGEAIRVLSEGVPIHSQGSTRPLTRTFAEALNARVGGGYHVVLANTGAEAVEAAMKHAMLATGGSEWIALEGAFHGKTLGTVQLAGSPHHREPFDIPGMPVHRVRLNDVAHLEAIFAAAQQPAGFFIEPIQGEGGVHEMNSAFAQRAAELCRQRGIPLIADECQTGVGRTGRFLACEHLGVRPDYVVLCKALGGGIAKVAALLVQREQYQPAFDQKHSSTFAGDELSSAVALRVLAMVDDALLARVCQQGDRLRAGLTRLAGAFPTVIADVRGRGLMLAIQLRSALGSNSFVLRTRLRMTTWRCSPRATCCTRITSAWPRR